MGRQFIRKNYWIEILDWDRLHVDVSHRMVIGGENFSPLQNPQDELPAIVKDRVAGQMLREALEKGYLERVQVEGEEEPVTFGEAKFTAYHWVVRGITLPEEARWLRWESENLVGFVKVSRDTFAAVKAGIVLKHNFPLELRKELVGIFGALRFDGNLEVKIEVAKEPPPRNMFRGETGFCGNPLIAYFEQTPNGLFERFVDPDIGMAGPYLS